MVIQVKFDGHKWTISPDPAIVPIGTIIQWLFETTRAPATAITWTVYFENSSPFAEEKTVKVTSKGIAAKQMLGPPVFNHSGKTSPLVANQAGDHKYGVRAEDSLTGQVYGDDDPRLIVLA